MFQMMIHNLKTGEQVYECGQVACLHLYHKTPKETKANDNNGSSMNLPHYK